MLLDREKSCLLLIDVQEKLTPHVQNSKELIASCAWLLRLVQDLNIPFLVSEQYPKGLGGTVEPLRQVLPKTDFLEKIHFSCWGDLSFRAQLKSMNKKHLVLIGIETHVCVLQTALELREEGYEVFVVIDAVSSRIALDSKYALKRMKQHGVFLLTSEMVFFEWLRHAGSEEFKRLSKAYLK